MSSHAPPPRGSLESADFLQLVLDASPHPIFVKDGAGRFVLANRALAASMGLTVEEVVDQLNATVHPYPEEIDRFSAVDQQVIAEGRTITVEEPFTRTGGEVAWYSTVKTPLRRADGSLNVLGISTDITAYKRAEDLIRELNRSLEARNADQTIQLGRSGSLLEATLEATADGILVVDLGGRIALANGKFAELWRIARAASAPGSDGRLLERLSDQLADPAAFRSALVDLQRQPERAGAGRIGFRDGRTFDWHSQPQRRQGQIEGRVWSFRDVSEQVRTEEQLRHAQKMEAVGRLAGGVAHDFNNLLTAIMGYAGLIAEQVERQSELGNDVEAIRLAAERAAELTSQLLTLSRRQVVQPRVVDLNEVVGALEPLLGRVVGAAVALAVEPSHDPALILVDRGQIERVVMNLVVNARDALPRGGTVRIGTAVSRPPAPAPATVTLVVADDGVGMDAATRARVFEPFFTTKTSGTGLGLATAYAIVAQSGGLIDLASAAGAGTTVTMTFPLASGAAAAGALATQAPSGHETLLLVEDEGPVRLVMRRMLEARGYRVIDHGDPRDALATFERMGSEIQLVVSDVVMPDLDGPTMAARMTEIRPGLPVLFVSGHTENRLPRLAPGHGFLAKPFAAEALLTKVREMLDAPVS